MQAVIKSGSSQFLIKPGQELVVNKLSADNGKLTFSDVLMFADGQQVLVGTPYLSGYSVKAEIVGQVKGEKIRVFKFKAKSRYRRHTGFRAMLSKIKILSIETPESAKAPVSSAKPAAAPVKSATRKKPRGN